MPRLSDRTPEEVDGRKGLDPEIGSPTSRLLVVSGAVGTGALVGLTAHSVFLLWLRLKPSRPRCSRFLTRSGCRLCTLGASCYFCTFRVFY